MEYIDHCCICEKVICNQMELEDLECEYIDYAYKKSNRDSFPFPAHMCNYEVAYEDREKTVNDDTCEWCPNNPSVLTLEYEINTCSFREKFYVAKLINNFNINYHPMACYRKGYDKIIFQSTK